MWEVLNKITKRGHISRTTLQDIITVCSKMSYLTDTLGRDPQEMIIDFAVRTSCPEGREKAPVKAAGSHTSPCRVRILLLGGSVSGVRCAMALWLHLSARMACSALPLLTQKIFSLPRKIFSGIYDSINSPKRSINGISFNIVKLQKYRHMCMPKRKCTQAKGENIWAPIWRKAHC